MRKTKIVCTLGPASREPEVLDQLISAGLDVARFNFSHGDHDYHKETITRVREAAERAGKPIALLADLQGPKLRLGNLGEGVPIKEGESIVLTTDDVIGQRLNGNSKHQALIPIQYQNLPRDVQVNEHILIDDGLVEIAVQETTDTEIVCEVVVGGMLRSKKGINLPGTKLSVPAITEKDWSDLQFALDMDMDWIALSFVRRAEEVYELKAYIQENWELGTQRPLVISKIEKPEALEEIDAIVEASDGIMVARGDLGIEIPTEKVPLVQKDLIRRCNHAGKPVITATQMLDSMIRNPRPTRAEASDVANAIIDGSDAIMLSGETAAGKYPIEAVETMVSIAMEIEAVLADEVWHSPHHVTRLPDDVTDSVSYSTVQTAEAVDAAAIITATASGRTARGIARYRPRKPIIAVTTSHTTRRQLVLTWGIIPIFSGRVSSTDEIIGDSVALATQTGLINEGDYVVLTAGIANNLPGTTNLMLVERVGAQEHVQLNNVTDE